MRYGRPAREVKKFRKLFSDLDSASMLVPTFSAPPAPSPLLRLTRLWTGSPVSPDILPISRMYSRCLPTTSGLP